MSRSEARLLGGTALALAGALFGFIVAVPLMFWFPAGWWVLLCVLLPAALGGIAGVILGHCA